MNSFFCGFLLIIFLSLIHYSSAGGVMRGLDIANNRGARKWDNLVGMKGEEAVAFLKREHPEITNVHTVPHVYILIILYLFIF